MNSKYLVLAGLAGSLLTTAADADVTLVVTGGNASRTVLYDRAANLLTGPTVVNGPNSNIKSYLNGTIAGQPGLGNVTIHFVLNGAAQGLKDLRDQVGVPTTAGSLTAQLAVSGVSPQTVSIDPSIFASLRTLVIPFVYAKNSALPNSLHGVTNLTQRQAALLEASSGTLPTAFFGGESTTDVLYLIGRDTGAAVRQVIDANIYFSGSPAFWTTNAVVGQPPILNPLFGHSGGGQVVSDLFNIPNAIGTVALSDATGFTVLSYEGFQPTAANVAKGFYPIWNYESWFHKNSGAGQPSANQQTVINLLLAKVTDPTYQTTSPLFVNTFIPLSQLEVERTSDGGPITSLIY